MPTVEELLANKAKVDEEFWELLEEVWKMEAEEKRRAEEKRKAEEAEEKHLKEERDKALAKKRAEEAEEKKQKACEVDEMWRMEEAEARKKKAKAKALADEIVENHQRTEEVQRPSSSKVVVPRSIGGVLLSTLMAHQIVSEVAWSWEKVPKVLGSRLMISIASDSDLDNWEECEMCFRQSWKC